jgi:hypothetical protein
MLSLALIEDPVVLPRSDSSFLQSHGSSGKYGKIRKRIAIKSCRAIDEMLNSN